MAKPTTGERRDDPVGRVVAGNIRRLRRYRGWTQAQVAEQLAPYIGGQLTPAAISQWEDGRNPGQGIRRFSITELWAICKVFNVSLSSLLFPGVGRWSTFDGVEIPDLFGEPYFSVWEDCFADIGEADQLMWEGSLKNRAPEQSDSVPTGSDSESTLAEAIEIIRRAHEEGRL
jgi:transcriptional regulator with XRE-family HTH domain